MNLSPGARMALRVFTGITLALIYLPLALVLLNSVNTDRTFAWPPTGFTGKWWSAAWHSTGARDALLASVQVGIFATLIALVLGTMAAFAVQRYSFFGKRTLSLLVVLPIALPGIVTGIALSSAFHNQLGVQLSMATIVIGHATFCIVIVFNNVVARLRRMNPNLEEASADLGADPFTTFRRVTLPAVRSALFAGALLAFALSFDEIVVTTFTAPTGVRTLPLWIFDNLARPNQAPVVNVVAVVVILLSLVPIWLAQRLTDGAGTLPAAGTGAATS